jgi:hypothetical protein
MTPTLRAALPIAGMSMKAPAGSVDASDTDEAAFRAAARRSLA